MRTRGSGGVGNALLLIWVLVLQVRPDCESSLSVCIFCVYVMLQF